MPTTPHECTRADYEKLLILVNNLRVAQREYFRTRNQAAMEDAKRWERAVDRLLESETGQQLKLF